MWKSQWPGSMLLTEGSGNQGGVAILFSGDLKPKILRVNTHDDDRFILSHFELEGRCYSIASVYMPTSDHEISQLEILSELEEALEDEEGETEVFLGGDFNVSMNSDLDRQGYVHPQINNTSFRTHLISFLERLDLVDVWRTQNPLKISFSWSRAHKMARLDYIFAPSSFLGVLESKAPTSCSFSDHRLLSLTVNPREIPRGRGFWRMQASVLEREDFRLKLRDFLTSRINDSPHLPHDIRWEFIKLGIREFSIQYCSKLNQESRCLERNLEDRLFILEKEMVDSPEVAEEYHATKRELLQIQLLASRQAMLRSRTKWLTQGERPTSYFLNMEKRNYNEKTISAIFNAEEVLLTRQEDILEFEKEHFQEQHSRLPEARIDLNVHPDPFSTPSASTVDDLDRAVLNDILSLEELEKSARSMQTGKSPGCDGIPIEFYKLFWDLVGPLLLSCFTLATEKGILTADQRRAVVTLIPKKHRDKRYINNWRPISVLNVDYKIFAKALALRLANVIPILTHHNQTGFVPSRYIGDSIKNIHSIIDFLNETGRGGLILSLDFKAAFDSLDHSFLFRVLESYNLGENFLSWIKTLYNSSESCILNRGFSSGWFPFQRGIRQGCPISPFLFILAVERLAESIRSNDSIKGINLLSSHTKIQQFADDSTLFMNDEESLLQSLKTIESFRTYSGLALNLSKTFGLNIGDIRLESEVAREIKWRDSLHILGITFFKCPSGGRDFEYNFAPSLNKMENICADWSKRTLSLKGKVVLINSLILPVIYFQCTMLAVSARVHSEVNRMISSFLWAGKKPKVSKNCLELPTAQGGLGLHNFKNRVASSKITWVKRAARPTREPWHFYLEFRADKSPYETFLQRLVPPRVKSSPFYRELLHHWKELNGKQPNTDMSVRNESLWGNKFLRGKFKKKLQPWCDSLDIRKVQDLIYADRVISPTQFEGRYQVSPKRGLLESFQHILPQEWTDLLVPINKFTEEYALYVPTSSDERVNLHILSTKSIYDFLQSTRKSPYTCDLRWEKIYGGGNFWSSLKWKHWHLLPYRVSHSVQLQNFMFRVAYRIIPTNVYLNRLRVVDSELCRDCNRRDDLLHFFIDCEHVNPFWDSLATWMDQNDEVMDFPEDLSEEEFLLGTTVALPSHYLFNFIIMWAKFYVYKTKIFGNRTLDLFQFLLELKSRLTVERLACFADGSYNRRFRRWQNFLDSF